MPKEFGDKYLHEIIWDLGEWLMDMPRYVIDLALDEENEENETEEASNEETDG